MIATLARVAKIVTRQQAATIARTALKVFREQTREITRRGEEIGRLRRQFGIRAMEEITVPGGGREFLDALAEFAAAHKLNLTGELVPPIQSTIGQGYSRTALTLGLDPVDTQFNQGIAAKARAVAEQIVDINGRTRDRTEELLKQYMSEGLHPSEIAARLTADMDAYNKTRALCIGRTEANRAWTQGSIQAIKELGTCTHISVIGCESREPERWDQPSYQEYMYRGESTCNAEDVPIADAENLVFHPNHSATIVPSVFLEDASETRAES